MNITNAQYVNDRDGVREFVKCTIDGQEWWVPLVEGNTYYDEIMRQVAEDTLTIADAD